ncbi:MAG: DUF4115 domain-containing protein [Bacillota bacterium]|nr:DUF4115 domain-containing protein [Bacillota bacterium]
MSLGKDLSSARERKGLTIQQVKESTQIDIRYLKALEKEELSILPDKEIALSYLDTYGSFLNLEVKDLTSQFNKLWSDTNTAKDFLKESLADKQQKSVFQSYKNIFLIASVAILIAISIFTFGAKPDKQTNENPNTIANNPSPEATEPKLQSDKEDISDANTPASSNETINQEINDKPVGAILPANIAIEVAAIRGDCWLEVTVDGKLALYRLVKVGEEPLQFTGTQEINILIGNAAAVDMTFNGESLGPLGTEGQVVRKVLKNLD